MHTAKTICCSALCLLLPAMTFAAMDMFLEIDGVNGESTDSAHTDWVDVQSFSHSVTAPNATNSGLSRLTAGAAVHSALQITKYIDKATPILNLYCCAGRHITEVKLELCHVVGGKACFYKITLKDVLVTGVSVAGDTDGIPTETVHFTYGEIQWRYTPTDPGTGNPTGAAISTGWSVVMEKEL